MRHILLTSLIVALAFGPLWPPVAAGEDPGRLKQWVEEMKSSPKGPFARIRWFCNDGSILPPEPFACVAHGGGRQHGEWNGQVRTLRAEGYLIGNVLAAADAPQLASPAGWEALRQLLLERFLIGFDDGWIFRGARSYRGALQAENEIAGGRRILAALNRTEAPDEQTFLLLREAARLLPHGTDSSAMADVHRLASSLAQKDPAFAPLRIKLHGHPQRSDAQRVREHAARAGVAGLAADYEKLARSVERLFYFGPLHERLAAYAREVHQPELERHLRHAAQILGHHLDPETRLETSAELMASLRRQLPALPEAGQKITALDLSLALEQEVFSAASALIAAQAGAPRAQRLTWLGPMVTALYGSGLISARQLHALQASLRRLQASSLPLSAYRRELRYLSRLPGWADRWLQFHFRESWQHLAQIEPLARQFPHERLRISPLLAFASILDSLLRDADRLAGVENRLFGTPVGQGLHALNPGLARGILRLTVPAEKSRPGDIVLLPETTADLPPVAGILTQGEGNSLSHVQLLAGNLGIPNVVVEPALVAHLAPHDGQDVVLAVSPGGTVRLERDGPGWDAVFGRETGPSDTPIDPDLAQLDLSRRTILSLDQLRADDAGRIVGPKAANLGELKHQFPDAVGDGLVLPFGLFREHLQQPWEDGEMTAFAWMQQQYRQLEDLQGPAREQATARFLERLRQWIVHAEPGEDFRRQLRRALQNHFGEDGSYALFVRSDTNIEDLPGFTGAGLNLTVPNVVGFEQVLEAILKVWASPFGERPYAWRQGRMAHPEHVYPSVLLMPSVPVEKSGVMLTLDIQTGSPLWLTVATNRGIGGAVQGEAAEELLISAETGAVRLLAEATASSQRVLTPSGGLVRQPAPADGRVLTRDEIRQLRQLALDLRQRFPQFDEHGRPTAADVEFGFLRGRLVLFQVRPYLRNRQAQTSHYLAELDRPLAQSADRRVDLDVIPRESTP